MADDLPPLPTSPRGVRRALIELDRASGAARRRSLVLRSRLGARRVGAGLRLDLHPTVVVGHHVVIEAWHGTRSSVVIGEGVRLGDHTFISMRGGSFEIGGHTELRRGVTINCSGRLAIGDEVLLNTGTHLHCSNDVEIGEWTIFGEYCSVVDSKHVRTDPGERIQHATERGRVRIGRNVWMGAKATVAADVVVGDQAVVAAGAVVTRDVPAGMLAAGVPARVARPADGSTDGTAALGDDGGVPLS